MGPHDLRRLAERVVEAIDPDGTVPDDQVQQDRRFFRWRHARDGSFRGEFRLTPQAGAKLKAILGPRSLRHTSPASTSMRQPSTPTIGRERFARTTRRHPRHHVATGVTEPGASAAGRRVVEDDPRSHDQRMHDALEAVCDRLLRTGGLTDANGTPATVIISMDADDLASRAGTGLLSDGSPVSVEAVIDLTDQAEVAWCVKNSRGSVLALGRSRRIASRQQSLALIVRDGGCSFPRLRHRPGVVRAAPCGVLDRRRRHRSGQPDLAVSLSPPQLRWPRLGMPDQFRSAPGVDTPEMDRPAAEAHPPSQDPNEPLARSDSETSTSTLATDPPW